MVAGMNWDKKDALNVNCSLIGMDCGVLVVGDYFEANLAQKKQRKTNGDFVILCCQK